MPDVKKVNSGLLEFSEDQQILVAIDEDGEIQKAVIIDEDGSESPIGTTPSGKITITENGTDIDVAQYATADVAVEGGSSDFSTAEVTLINTNADDISIANLPIVYVDDEEMWGNAFIDANSQATLTLILYLGKTLITSVTVGSTPLADGTGITVTGDIDNKSDEYEVYIEITGDGTITF